MASAISKKSGQSDHTEDSSNEESTLTQTDEASSSNEGTIVTAGAQSSSTEEASKRTTSEVRVIKVLSLYI